MGVWFTPTLTVGHLLFAVCMTLYIQVGLYFEERALLREHGEPYRDYMLRVPKLIPGWLPSAPARDLTALQGRNRLTAAGGPLLPRRRGRLG